MTAVPHLYDYHVTVLERDAIAAGGKGEAGNPCGLNRDLEFECVSRSPRCHVPNGQAVIAVNDRQELAVGGGGPRLHPAERLLVGFPLEFAGGTVPEPQIVQGP